MASIENKPNVGKELFSRHQAELEQGLRMLAAALAPTAESSLSGFFHDFVDGFWNPFEAICKYEAEQHIEISEEIRSLEHSLAKGMPAELKPVFERHDELMMERHTSGLDLAFLVGFQCATRFIMMGLMPAGMVFPRNE